MGTPNWDEKILDLIFCNILARNKVFKMIIPMRTNYSSKSSIITLEKTSAYNVLVSVALISNRYLPNKVRWFVKEPQAYNVLAQVFFCEFCEIFKNIYRTLLGDGFWIGNFLGLHHKTSSVIPKIFEFDEEKYLLLNVNRNN